MAFLEQRLSDRTEFGAKGGPVNHGRQMIRTASGRLRQVFTWSEPLHTYTVSHGVLDQAQMEELRSFWYVVNFTPYEGFRFRDWTDYQATQDNSRCTLISGSDYQLQRIYKVGSIEFVRKIQKPASGAVVYRTRSSVVSAATASVDTTTGIATISSHVSGDTYTWVGEFDIPVTFSDQEWVSELLAATQQSQLTDSPEINLEEILL